MKRRRELASILPWPCMELPTAGMLRRNKWHGKMGALTSAAVALL